MKIKFVGVYIRDQFDFNGDDSLGYWNAETNKVSLCESPRGRSRDGQGFLRLAGRDEEGGDFEVFCTLDLLLTVPEVIVI